MNTYLITGGTGFISANLIRTLLVKAPMSPIHIITQQAAHIWRLHDIIDQISIHKARMDDHETITQLIHTIKPTHIFHLAAYGGMPHEQDQSMIFKVNLLATINLLNACKAIGFTCFINTGSSSEYGTKTTPMREDDLLEPLSDYGVAKAAATQFCLKEARMHRLPIYTIRPFSVYGPYEAPQRLLPTIIANALMQRPIRLGSPQHVRDFIYVDDLIGMYLNIATQLPKDFSVFNAGTGIQHTIQNVAEKIQLALPYRLHIEWGMHTPRPWEPLRWQADISRAHSILNWQPIFTLEQGIEATIAWMLKHHNFYDETSNPAIKSANTFL